MPLSRHQMGTTARHLVALLPRQIRGADRVPLETNRERRVYRDFGGIILFLASRHPQGIAGSALGGCTLSEMLYAQEADR